MQTAIFPLPFVKRILELKTASCDDFKLSERFGYIRCFSMAPAVYYKEGGLSNVHCGSFPLVGCAWIAATKRFGGYNRHAYINSNNEVIYPG